MLFISNYLCVLHCVLFNFQRIVNIFFTYMYSVQFLNYYLNEIVSFLLFVLQKNNKFN